MKKLAITFAIILGITLGGFAQNRGLFNLGPQSSYDQQEQNRLDDGLLSLPSTHGDANDQGAPLGGGALLLIGFGAAYALKKRNEK